MVVKKTFRYSNVFFYNHLCRASVFRNIIMESGIKAQKEFLFSVSFDLKHIFISHSAAVPHLILNSDSYYFHKRFFYDNPKCIEEANNEK